MRTRFRDTPGIAFRYPQGDEKGICAFVADRNRLAFARGHLMAFGLHPWNAITPLPDAPSVQEHQVVEDSIARIGQPFLNGPPDLTEDDKVWIVDAFPMLDSLSGGWLSETEVPSAAWHLEARTADPRMQPGAVGDAVALHMIDDTHNPSERAAAERFGAIWPSKRSKLLEVIVDQKAIPAPR